jgi:hypothetical protein
MNMNIDRHNYEEFFLLYVDNELSPAERKAVETFVAENTDLQSELDLMKDAVLHPEPTLSFDFKASLMKPEGGSGLINNTNCEEYFLLYADNELNAEQKMMVEKFVYHHPQHQVNFELLQQVKMAADTSVVFPDKSLLYRQEKDDKVVPFGWWKMMAAAVVLLAVGIASWYLISNNSNSGNIQPPVVVQKNPVTPSPSTKASDPVNQSTENNAAAGTAVNEAHKQAVPDETPESRNTAAVVKNSTADQRIVKTKVTPEEKNINPGNIQIPSNVSPIEQNVVINNQPVVTQKPIEEVAKPDPTQTMASLVSSNPTTEQAGYQEYVDEGNSDIVFVANTSVSKKSKLRGVFRKASRFIEKATNLEPGSRGIRVANVEIGLK